MALRRTVESEEENVTEKLGEQRAIQPGLVWLAEIVLRAGLDCLTVVGGAA